MTGKAHLTIGIAATVAVSKHFKIDINLASLTVCSIASVFPDIDHPKSLINKYILPVKNKSVKLTIYLSLGIFIIALNMFYFNYSYLNVIGIFLILIGVSTHREGVIHSLSGLFIFSLTFAYTSKRFGYSGYSIPFFIGYISHIIADMFTNRGVPLFYPFIKKKFKMPLTFKVGSWQGKIVEGLIMASCLMYITFEMPYILSSL